MRQFAVALCFCMLIPLQSTLAKNRKDVPLAPLPAVITNAKRIFLSNGGGSNLAYDAFYAEIKQWGKCEIAGSPDEADLIIELAYQVDKRTGVASSPILKPNKDMTGIVQTGTNVHSYEVDDPQVVLTIYDAKTKTSLWSDIEHRKLVTRRNRDKEIIKTVQRLVADLKARTSPPVAKPEEGDK
jgi:hypothetical protein